MDNRVLGLDGGSSISTNDLNNKKRKFFRSYLVGELDTNRITNQGWKSIYEYGLETGHFKLDDIGVENIKKYNVIVPKDLNLSTPSYEAPKIDTPEIQTPQIERKGNVLGNLLNKTKSLFENKGPGVEPGLLNSPRRDEPLIENTKVEIPTNLRNDPMLSALDSYMGKPTKEKEVKLNIPKNISLEDTLPKAYEGMKSSYMKKGEELKQTSKGAEEVTKKGIDTLGNIIKTADNTMLRFGEKMGDTLTGFDRRKGNETYKPQEYTSSGNKAVDTVADVTGSLAGILSPIGGVGSGGSILGMANQGSRTIVDNALKKVTTNPTTTRVIERAITGSIIGGTKALSSGKDLEGVTRDTLINGVFYGAGTLASKGIESGLVNQLDKLFSMYPDHGRLIQAGLEGAKGVGFSVAGTMASIPLYKKGERPTTKELIEGAVVHGLTSMILSSINGEKYTPRSKEGYAVRFDSSKGIEKDLVKKGYTKLGGNSPLANDIYVNQKTKDIIVLSTKEGPNLVPRSMSTPKYDELRSTLNKEGIEFKGINSNRQVVAGRPQDIKYKTNLDSASKVKVDRMVNQGYKEAKPGIWTKEVDGKIVDVVPLFAMGESAMSVPVFKLQDANKVKKDIDRSQYSGFLGTKTDANVKREAPRFKKAIPGRVTSGPEVKTATKIKSDIKKIFDNDAVNKVTEISTRNPELVSSFMEKLQQISQMPEDLVNAVLGNSILEASMDKMKEFDTNIMEEGMYEFLNDIEDLIDTETKPIKTSMEEDISKYTMDMVNFMEMVKSNPEILEDKTIVEQLNTFKETLEESSFPEEYTNDIEKLLSEVNSALDISSKISIEKGQNENNSLPTNSVYVPKDNTIITSGKELTEKGIKLIKENKKKCYEVAFEHNQKEGGVLTYGKITGVKNNGEMGKVNHAWVDYGDYVYEPQYNSFIDKKFYNEELEPTIIGIYSQEEARKEFETGTDLRKKVIETLKDKQEPQNEATVKEKEASNTIEPKEEKEVLEVDFEGRLNEYFKETKNQILDDFNYSKDLEKTSQRYASDFLAENNKDIVDDEEAFKKAYDFFKNQLSDTSKINTEAQNEATEEEIKTTNTIEPIEETKALEGQIEGTIENKVTLKDYGINIAEGTTKNGTPILEVTGNTKEYSEVFGRLGLKGRFYRPKKTWSFTKKQFNSIEDLEKAILEKLPKKEVEAKEEVKDTPKVETKSDTTLEKETQAIEKFKERMLKLMNDGSFTDSQIKRQNEISEIQANELLKAIKEKDFEELIGRLHRNNPNSLKLFSEVTGLPTGSNTLNKESIRSLDKEAFDKWEEEVKNKIQEEVQRDREEEIKTKEKEKEESFNKVADKRITIAGKTDTLRNHINRLYEEGYRLEQTNEYGGYEWINNKTNEKLSYDKFSKEEKKVIRKLNEELTEKRINEEAEREEAEIYENMTPEERKEHDEMMDHLFGKKEVKGEGEEIGNKSDDREEPSGTKTEDVSETKDGRKPREVSNREGRTGQEEISKGGETSGETISREGEHDLSGKTTEQQPNLSPGMGNSLEGVITSTGNFTITEEDNIGEGGLKTKFKNNIEAIRLLKTLEKEGRLANLEEQRILAKYVGWGAMGQAFEVDHKTWGKEARELKELLTDEEYKNARASTLNAHYTDTKAIKAMYDIVKRLGFNGGKILEPSMGVGNFFGMLPEELRNSKLTGVELDTLTGNMAKHLYQEAKIHVMGFEKLMIPNNYYDLAIGNVPFGDFKVKDKDYDNLNLNIHDYFFAKSVDKVKEGGIVAFITSKGTLDKKDKTLRNYLDSKVELVGVIRLPNDAFKKNAGTSVTTDLIILRKLKQGETSNNKWFNIGEIDGVPVNEYFVDNPDMLLGKMVKGASMYGNEDETSLVSDGRDIYEAINTAIKNLPQNIFDTSTPIKEVEEEPLLIGDVALGEFDKVGSLIVKDNVAYKVTKDRLVPITQNKTITKNGKKEVIQIPVEGKKLERIKALHKLKEAVRLVGKAQLKELGEREILATRKHLNTLYDSFIKEHGYVSDNANRLVFLDDPDYPRLKTLEKYNAKTKKYDKSEIFHKRTIVNRPEIEKVETSIDALAVSLNQLGRVDIDKMINLTSKDKETIIKELKGEIFKDPAKGYYVTADEYLSGNVVAKLKVAKVYLEDDKDLEENVKALEKVQPEKLKAKDIAVKLGSSWVEPEMVTNFANELLETENIKVSFVSLTGNWLVDGYSENETLERNRFGTNDLYASELIEKLLNSKEIKVLKYIGTGDDKALDKVASRKATILARQRADLIMKSFKDWIFKDVDRRNYLEEKYNNLFNSTVLRKYKGSFLTFKGMNENISLREYQKDAIARMVFGGNVLLAHTVGAGKTFEMVAGALELKRLGIANKPMFVVPNHLIEQWANAFYTLYPNANILATTKDDFKKDRRQELMGKIANNNYDAVIVAHSSFGRLPVSKETEENFLQNELDDLEEAIILAREESGSDKSITKDLEKAKKRLEEKIKKLQESERDNTVEFEELGVDYLFVDEAHNFKNLFFHTKMGRIAGVTNSQSKRATDMYMKTKYITNLHNGSGGLVFASGTPVSNSMTEMFTMQRFLQMQTLEAKGLKHFDSWASDFGEVVTNIEVDKTGKGFKSKQRFSKFFNVPELLKMFRDFSDILSQDDLREALKKEGAKVGALPELDGGKPIAISVEPSEDLERYIEELEERSKAIEQGLVDPSEDNHLKITNDGRLGALDMRLVDPSYKDYEGSKLNKAVEVVFKEWKEGNKERTTQLIFSDLGTPKKKKSQKELEKLRKKVKLNGYETFKWYYDSENDKNYIVLKINKEEEEITKLYEDEELLTDSIEETNPDREVTKPIDFEVDIDEYLEKLEGGEEIEVNFDIYNDIKDKLVNMGIPENEVAFIHDAKTDLAKEKLFDKVRKGEVRILLGSTAKMGEGMNVQDRLIALHHLDAPWKPSSVEQRNGRIVRFGNIHDKVRVYHYVTKDSFDAYIWQLIENKAKFIAQIMSGNITSRSMDDAFDPVVLNAGQIKALASKDPRILEKINLDQKVSELEVAKESYKTGIYELQDRLKSNEKRIKWNEDRVKGLETDIRVRKDTKGDKFSINILGKTFSERKEAGEFLIGILDGMDKFTSKELGDFAGFKLTAFKEADIEDTKLIINGKLEHFSYASSSPTGIISKLEHTLRSMDDYLKSSMENIEQAKKEIEYIKEELKKPFEREEELKELYEKQSKLNTELTLEATKDNDLEEEAKQSNDVNKSSAYVGGGVSTDDRDNISDGKVKPVRVIFNEIKKNFNVSIRSKRYRGKRAIAKYRIHPQAIETKIDNNIGPVMHELGHHLDNIYNLSKSNKALIKKMIDKLPSNFKDAYKDEELPGEAIAEFVRLYLTSPSHAREFSGEFYEVFESTLSDKDLEKLRGHRKDILNWLGQDTQTKIESTIDYRTEKKDDESLVSKKIRAEMELFDNLAPFRELVKRAEYLSGKKVKAEDNTYKLGLHQRTSDMISRTQIEIGMTNYKGEFIEKPLSKIYSKIENDDKRAFDGYLKSVHAIDLAKEDKRVFSDDIQISDVEKQVKDYEKKYPHFKEVAKELHNWWNKFTKTWLVDTGLVDEELWNQLREKYPNYVPNYRVQENFINTSKGIAKAKKGFSHQRSPIKKMKGSAKDTYSVLESLIVDVDKMVKIAKRREVMLSIHRLYNKVEGLGEIIEKVPPKMLPNVFDARSLKEKLIDGIIEEQLEDITDEEMKKIKDMEFSEAMKYLEDKGVTIPNAIDEVIADRITFFTPQTYEMDREIVTVIDENGKQHHYMIHDPYLLEAILGLEGKNINMWLRMLGQIKRFMTVTTTGSNPIFGVTSNIWKDLPQAFIMGTVKNPAKFIKGMLESYKDMFTGDEIINEYHAMGGGHSSPISADRNLLEETLNKMIPGRKKNIKHFVNYLISRLEAFNDVIETAPRLTIYKDVKEKLGDDYNARLEAIYEASDLTLNYLKKGNIAHSVGQVVPFLNAGLQGSEKVYRGLFKEKDKRFERFLKGLVSVTLFSIVSFLMYKDDEDYNNLSPFIKDNYWLIKTGDGKFIRIPKSREYSFLFGTVFERTFRQVISEDPEAWEGITQTLKNNFIPPNPLTDNIFAPLIQVATNKRWSGSPVVPRKLEGLPEDLQYDINTSELAKNISKVMPDSFGKYKSPMAIDYIIGQYTGVIGQTVLPATTKSTSIGEQLKRKVTTDGAYSDKNVSKFYDEKAKMDKDYNRYKETGVLPKGYDPVIHKAYKDTYNDLSKLWKEIEEVNNDESLSKNQRQDKVREVRLKLNEVAKEGTREKENYSVEEFSVVLNKAQEINRRVEEARKDKTKLELTSDERLILNLYARENSPIRLTNSKLNQLKKRINQIEESKINQDKKDEAIEKINKSIEDITSKFMETIKRNNLDIKGLY